VVEYNTSTNNTENGVVKDTSGRGNDGRLRGSASYDSTEKAFDIVASSDIITTGTSIGGVSGDFLASVSVWINPDDVTTASSRVIFIHTSQYSVGTSLVLLMWEDELVFGHGDTNNQYVNGVVSQTGKWYHVVAIKKGTGAVSNDIYEIYIDGVKQTLTTSAGTGVMNVGTDQAIIVGSAREAGTNTEQFTGKISNVKYYPGTVLTADEVKRLYDMGRCDEGHHVVNFSKTRVGIGLGDGEAPRAELDVRGSAFASKYFGGLTTFLTGDYTSTAITSFTSAGQTIAMIEYTFDVPQEYHLLGRANLESQVMIKWCGEIEHPWNFMFYIDLYHSGLSTPVKSTFNTDSSGSRNNGAGVPVVNHHADYGSTLESAMIGSRIYIPNCDVSSGSTITVKLVGTRGNYETSATVYTNRTKNDNDSLDYERGITNFFMALKVV
jgi:hypothetical protein